MICWDRRLSAPCSDLVERSDVNRLDLLIEGLDGLLKVVSADLRVLHDATNHNLVHTVSDGLLLVLGLPEEAVHLDGEDLLSEGIEVGLSLVGLDFEDDQGLGDGSGLHLDLGGLLLAGLKGSLGSLLAIK